MKDLAILAVATLTASLVSAEPARPKVSEPELAGLVSIAPYADVSTKVTSFHNVLLCV